jgi:uncharacterized membrane protein (UPF0127 family)
MRYRNRSITARLTAACAATVLLSAVMTGLAGCASETQDNESLKTDITFTPEGILDFVRPDSSIISRIIIELAETPEEQAQGLMYRRSLPDRGGMLFIDAGESMRSFWMKNTPLALDIIFVDAKGEIVNIVKRTTPYSEDFIESTAPAQYVVEVRAGFTDRYGISEDDRISWRRQTFETDTES